MSVITAFSPQGNTISFTTSGTPSTAQSVQITPTNFGVGGPGFPSQVRVVNRGTADVWISFTPLTATIAIPTPGTTTVGTPALAICILPGIVEVFTLPSGPTLWMNNISTGTSQTYHVLIGEGM